MAHNARQRRTRPLPAGRERLLSDCEKFQFRYDLPVRRLIRGNDVVYQKRIAAAAPATAPTKTTQIARVDVKMPFL